MFKSHLALVAVILCQPVVVCKAADSAPPASQPATASANDPMEAARAFYRATADGNEDAAFATMVFSNDASKREGHALIGDLANQGLLSKTIAETFHETAATAPLRLDDLDRILLHATVKIEGDTAVMDIGNPKQLTYFVRDKGLWKMDFAKTQAQQGPADDARIVEQETHVKIYKQVIADLKANKFKSADEARAAVREGLAKAEAARAPLNAGIRFTKATLSNVKAQLMTYEVSHDSMPTTAEGLKILIAAGLLENLPVDAWGQPFIYKCPGTKNPAFDLYSAGPDGKPGTDDDVWPD